MSVDISFDELSTALSYAFLVAAPTAPSSSAAKPAAKEAKKEKAAPAKKDDDFGDMFGDEEPASKPAAKKGDDDMDIFDYGDGGDEEDAEEAAAAKARRERIAAAAKLKKDKDVAEGKVKKDKEKPTERSLVVLEVKPWEADTNLEELWKQIIQYQQEGLQWGASFKLEPVAYGIMKLILTCTIEDAKVVMEDVTDAIEKFEDFVQSVQVASMNKV
jgi:translation elongation factor EF-1beta